MADFSLMISRKGGTKYAFSYVNLAQMSTTEIVAALRLAADHFEEERVRAFRGRTIA